MQNKTSFGYFVEGYRAATPLMVGVAPFGIVFGALAAAANLTMLEALGMSIFVIAGASQFVAAGLLAENAPALIIITTTLIINLRHLLYSASLATLLKPLTTPWKLLIGYFMIDEVYAPSVRRHAQQPMSASTFRWYFLGAGINLSTIWWATTLVGVALGDVLSDDTTDLLGFTLPLIFTSIVVPLIVNRPTLLAVASASAAAIFFAPLPHNLGLIVATLLGIVAGVLAERPNPQPEVSE